MAERLLRSQQDLRDTEEAHHHRDEADTVVKVWNAEREARRAALGVDPDHRYEEPDHHHQDAGDERASGKPRHHAETDEHEGEEFGRAEAERETGKRRRDPD